MYPGRMVAFWRVSLVSSSPITSNILADIEIPFLETLYFHPTGAANDRGENMTEDWSATGLNPSGPLQMQT